MSGGNDFIKSIMIDYDIKFGDDKIDEIILNQINNDKEIDSIYTKYNTNIKDRKIKDRKIKLCECGAKIYKSAYKCVSCSKLSQRKVERPSYEQLLKEVKEFGYSATGRKYGVSDNSIRKWIKYYEKIENTEHTEQS